MTHVIDPVDVLLSDGSTVRVRPIRPDDADDLQELHSRLSVRTRYLRYFTPYHRIPDRDLHRFANVDHRDREALVVICGGELIAVGRYDRLGPDAEDAEVAFVVEDAYQRRGIGSMLLEHLAAAARAVGIQRFVAEVLAENANMLRVFTDAGYQVQRRYAEGVVHLTFPIAPTEDSLAVQYRREQSTEARSIARLLGPRAVAVYGARRGGAGIGAALLGNLSTFTGPVYPVHFGSRLLEPADLAVIAVPAPAVLDAVTAAAAAGVAGVVVVSSGFAETGPAGEEAQRELLHAVRAAGIRLVGPNCLGIANTDPAVRLNATLAPALPPHGRVGFFSQSGALGVALLDTARRRGLGLSTFVSAGNRADVSGNDLLQYWQGDPATDVVLLYLETFGNPRKFARLARRLGRDKPIVAVAPAAPVPPFGGVIRVDTVTEMFDVAVLLAQQPLPGGTRVGIVTNSSALAALAAGDCGPAGLTVTARADVGPQASPAEFGEALQATAEDPEVDALVVACAPLSGLSSGFAAVLAEPLGKPMVATVLADEPPAGVPWYPTVEEGVRALGRVAAYSAWRRSPTGRVPELSTVDSPDPLVEYGIEVVPSVRVADPEEAMAAGYRFGFPVVVKLAGGRADLGEVRLDLTEAAAVERAAAELLDRFGDQAHVVVQPMVAPGVSCRIEAVEDPSFGPLVGFGLGGVTADLLGDQAWRAAPLTDLDADALIREPKLAPLLFGYRGAPPVAADALRDLLLRVGLLIDAHPEVQRLLLRPVLARPDGISVLDVTIQRGEPGTRADSGPRRLT
ncbi:MAG: GNAT family N-acetyltransferase [Actinobacteria bacterium]|nr:MAG: GNAT family N-acetyltransferase [Actinomycetota bacterium]